MELKVRKKLLNKVIGNQGELLTASYLKSKGFKVIEMNYRKPWGEIDVIATKGDQIHFVEVKTVSYGTKHDLEQAVLRGTYRPEENVHHFKLKKLARVIETWIQEHTWQGEWVIDVASVRIVPRETFSTINIIPNVIAD
ncbi:MAG: YraN family protein [Patescibacteria group bacterium]